MSTWVEPAAAPAPSFARPEPASPSPSAASTPSPRLLGPRREDGGHARRLPAGRRPRAALAKLARARPRPADRRSPLAPLPLAPAGRRWSGGEGARRGSPPHDGAVRLMLRLGFPPGVRGRWGTTPIHLAAFRGQTAPVGTLLTLGADVTTMADFSSGGTPLDRAAYGSRHATRELTGD